MRVAFHLSKVRKDEVQKALNNLENLRERNPEAKIHAVANTAAVTVLKQGGSFNERISELISEDNIKFKACLNSIENTDMEVEDLIETVETVDSGVDELAKLQENGYGYIKP